MRRRSRVEPPEYAAAEVSTDMVRMEMSSRSTEGAPFLLVAHGSLVCALEVARIAEVSRPLPVEMLAGLPECVIGLSIVRGQPLPVVDLGSLLGSRSSATVGRYVMLNLDGRGAVLAVEAVLGIHRFPPAVLREVPPLLREANPDLIAGIAKLDQKLLVVLEAARAVPPAVWERLASEKQAPS
jgi:purine-binding chemotaxis protein CheW